MKWLMFLIIDIFVFIIVYIISGWIRYYICLSIKDNLVCDYEPSISLSIIASLSLLLYRIINIK